MLLLLGNLCQKLAQTAIDLERECHSITCDDVSAEGFRSTSIGFSTNSSGRYSTALGFKTNATGVVSTVFGSYTIASGDTSTAMGASTVASGDTSTALGHQSVASGTFSTAIGTSTSAQGMASTAGGCHASAGDFATSLGFYSNASGQYSTCFGANTEAQAWYTTTTNSLQWFSIVPIVVTGHTRGNFPLVAMLAFFLGEEVNGRAADHGTDQQPDLSGKGDGALDVCLDCMYIICMSGLYVYYMYAWFRTWGSVRGEAFDRNMRCTWSRVVWGTGQKPLLLCSGMIRYWQRECLHAC